MWDCDPRLPTAVLLNMVCAVPIRQSTSTDHGLSAPGSLNDPRLNNVEAPSFAVWFAGAVTLG